MVPSSFSGLSEMGTNPFGKKTKKRVGEVFSRPARLDGWSVGPLTRTICFFGCARKHDTKTYSTIVEKRHSYSFFGIRTDDGPIYVTNMDELSASIGAPDWCDINMCKQTCIFPMWTSHFSSHLLKNFDLFLTRIVRSVLFVRFYIFTSKIIISRASNGIIKNDT